MTPEEIRNVVLEFKLATHGIAILEEQLKQARLRRASIIYNLCLSGLMNKEIGDLFGLTDTRISQLKSYYYDAVKDQYDGTQV